MIKFVSVKGNLIKTPVLNPRILRIYVPLRFCRAKACFRDRYKFYQYGSFIYAGPPIETVYRDISCTPIEKTYYMCYPIID